MMNLMIEAMERGYLPDSAIRFGIRNLCKERLESLRRATLEEEQLDVNAYIASLRSSPLAVNTREANEQHYELPPAFFNLALGKNRKYSSAYFKPGCKSLDEAEDEALQVTMERAELQDGMKILELGCGWGSLTLSMAKRYPDAKIIAISNSADQRKFIEGEMKARGLNNVTVLTRNIVEVENLDREFGKFDRIVSVEMFEHLRNYELLFERLSGWLKSDGKLFVHIFTHRQFNYFFETEGEDNWMGKYFFTGGQMPSHHLFLNFTNHLNIEKHWAWSGEHYGKTSEAWLENLDKNREKVLQIFKETYGPANAERWVQRWRVFFMACAELWNYDGGAEWGVSHYLFHPRKI